MTAVQAAESPTATQCKARLAMGHVCVFTGHVLPWAKGMCVPKYDAE